MHILPQRHEFRYIKERDRERASNRERMALKLLVCLALAVFVAGEEKLILDKALQKPVEDCKAENNITKEQVLQFIKKKSEATPEIKDFLMCVNLKTGMFDGMNWNRQAIKNALEKEEMMKYVEECLAKDDQTMDARERSLAMVVCCMEKNAFL